jgi:hypothetical protein
MTCSFDPNVCTSNCKKYSICCYYSIQNQFIELQSQINFIYKTFTDILKKNEENTLKIKLLEECFYNYICNEKESELRKNSKESDNEKDNK